MSGLDQSSVAWMKAHHATISTAAMRSAGVSLDRHRALVAGGTLERVVDGAYVFAGTAAGELARCAALCTSRPHLVVAGPTAGRLWELRRSPRDGLVHVIAPPASNPCRDPWVRAFRTALLDDSEVVRRRDGIRLTSPPRTVVDLTRYVDAPALASVIEHALSRRMCTVGTLHRTALRLATPGRPWVRRFLAVLERRDPGAPAGSEGELKVFEALHTRGVRGLQRQVHIELPGYGRAYFDMAVTGLRWAVEVDLHPVHNTVEGVASDNRRDISADHIGWAVHRVGELELASPCFDATIDALTVSYHRREVEVDALRSAGGWSL